jgi:hypothetical protein
MLIPAGMVHTDGATGRGWTQAFSNLTLQITMPAPRRAVGAGPVFVADASFLAAPMRVGHAVSTVTSVWSITAVALRLAWATVDSTVLPCPKCVTLARTRPGRNRGMLNALNTVRCGWPSTSASAQQATHKLLRFQAAILSNPPLVADTISEIVDMCICSAVETVVCCRPTAVVKADWMAGLVVVGWHWDVIILTFVACSVIGVKSVKTALTSLACEWEVACTGTITE